MLLKDETLFSANVTEKVDIMEKKVCSIVGFIGKRFLDTTNPSVARAVSMWLSRFLHEYGLFELW